MTAFLAKHALDGRAVQPMVRHITRPQPRKKSREEPSHGSCQTSPHNTSMLGKPGTRGEQRGC